MNAIIGLCHFCEAHGPRPLFCTFTTDNVVPTLAASQTSVHCQGCTSLGSETVFISRDKDGPIYCSRESVPNSDVAAILRQAAIRSITCEVSWNKEGGVVYFEDVRSHILSYTFQLKDTRARGLKRWFSIIVLMKDKMLLLNITPALSDHMKTISKELQDMAEKIYDEEQKICSQRALRLNTGRNDFGPSRPLPQLTGDEEIFKKLHSHFTWMLKAGALTYTETLYTSQDLIKILNEDATRTTLESHNILNATNDDAMPLRNLERLLGVNVFRVIMYCVLTGINVNIKTIITNPRHIICGLSRILPVQVAHTIPNVSCNMNVVSSTASMCILEEMEDKTFCIKWSGALPNKCPTLMNGIESALHNPHFNDDVLNQHIKSLQLEWLGTTRILISAISKSHSVEPVKKLKQILGITAQDELLINYWSKTFCT